MFESFRKHQKKFLAVLALMAMIAFTLDLSLFRNKGSAYQQNPVAFKMGGRDVRAADLDEMRRERLRANMFMQNFPDQYGRPLVSFGGTSDEEIRQAMILDREANRLGIPSSIELASAWIRQNFPNLTTKDFDKIYRSQFTEGPLSCTDTQLLQDIGKQIRIRQVYSMALDQQRTTPLDLYRGYRDQSERVSADVVSFPVAKYVGQVPEPTESQISTLYDQYKTRLPNPNLDTPGFKVPRKVRVEYVQIDSSELQRKLRDSMSDEDLRAYFKEHESDLPPPPRELPLNLFAGDPEAKLTPRTIDLFTEMKDTIRTAASEARASEEINRKFNSLRDEVMSPFLTQYDQVQADNADLADERATGKAISMEPKALPKPIDGTGHSLLATAAANAGLDYQETPLMTQTEAEKRVPISGASLGAKRFSTGRSFVDQLFVSRSGLYEPFELADRRGLRFLAWKTSDMPPEVPTLETVKIDVVQAWREIEARQIAEREAKALAEKAREAKGDLRTAAGDVPVIKTTDVSKSSTPFDPTGRRPAGLSRPNDIPELPSASEALRETLFSLKPGEVAVEANGPKSVYYVLTLANRNPADLNGLFSPVGTRSMLQPEIDYQIAVKNNTEWFKRLESLAGASTLIERTRNGQKSRTEEAEDHDHDHDHEDDVATH